MEIGDIITLKDDDEFRGQVEGVSGWGLVFVKVTEWGNQGSSQGYRSRTGVLDSARFPMAQVMKIEKEVA